MQEIMNIIQIGDVYHKNCSCDLMYIPIKKLNGLIEVVVRYKGKYLETQWFEPSDEIFSNWKEREDEK